MVTEPRWSVAEAGWKELLPDLPDEVIALLAAPVVASVEPSADEPGSTGPGSGDSGADEERYPGPAEPCAFVTRPYGERIARFLAPGEAPPALRV
jgi:hypothetical protein